MRKQIELQLEAIRTNNIFPYRLIIRTQRCSLIKWPKETKYITTYHWIEIGHHCIPALFQKSCWYFQKCKNGWDLKLKLKLFTAVLTTVLDFETVLIWRLPGDWGFKSECYSLLVVLEDFSFKPWISRLPFNSSVKGYRGKTMKTWENQVQ